MSAWHNLMSDPSEHLVISYSMFPLNRSDYILRFFITLPAPLGARSR